MRTTATKPSPLASRSPARHLARGALGFALIAAALALLGSAGPAALALVPAGMLALRGCPTCWAVGLMQTLSAGRIERECREGRCSLGPARAARASG
ncbi:MAG TPA: hypothetical protein VGY13_06955 [Solirubrobacteraceae bacterium]|jgi:hypothetical protein|nr:hypothetical protein [Solirubrobacteraceae bacterium]